MNARFLAPDAQQSDRLVSLPADEARHLTQVLRLGVGDRIRVFDGRGLEFDAVIERAGKSDVVARTGAACAPAPEPRVAVTLAQAVLKGDKMDDVVRDAVMLGVAAIQPLITRRTEVSSTVVERSRRVERWERVAVSSTKQCGRAVVPGVRPVWSYDQLPAAVGGELPTPALMLVEPRASTSACAIGDLTLTPPARATLIVGPEGGWTPEEIEAASPSCTLVTLGQRTLRADAAALIAMAALFAVWKEF